MENNDLNPLTEGKSFQKEFKTDKNKTYLINFTLDDSIEIEAHEINDLKSKSFSNKFSFQEIRINKYFLQFDSLNEIFDELNEFIKDDNIYKILIEENENNLKIKIQLPVHRNREITFDLKLQNKVDNVKINYLIQLINKQNKEISDLKSEITQLKAEDNQFRNEINDLKGKLKILWEKYNEYQNVNSKIISENEYKILKEWINPLKKIKAKLLYRLSENGDNKTTFHELCDDKGPTLTLFQVKDGKKVGIYTPLSWNTHSGNKFDEDTFIFNLNKSKKYKKSESHIASIYCDSSYGPRAIYFGCGNTNSMKTITHGRDINEFYARGSEILPSNNQDKTYDLLETEVYQVIIE